MKIKQYRAEDMRTALRQVRDAQGPDAVILSSRRVPGGVEVVAAVDYEGEDAATEQLAVDSGLVDTYGAERRQAQAQGNVSQTAPARAAQHDPALFGGATKPRTQNAPANEYMSERAELTRQFASQPAQARTSERALQTNRYMEESDEGAQRHAAAERAPGNRAGANERARYASEAQASGRARNQAEAQGSSDRARYAAETSASNDRGRYAVEAESARDMDLSRLDLIDANSDVNEELRTLRRMLETQLATLAWNDLSRRSPIQTELLKQLTQLGLAQELATEIVTQMPTRLELAEANRLALALLARKIETTGGERWMDGGGVVALVGATGVGKTTLIAKLAARWVMRHGPRDIALISTDSVRIGAQEQVQTLGRLLGVPAYALDGSAELADVLDHLSDKRLVLIDTAGLSPRDPRLEQELKLLSAASERMETTLVLSASAQAGAIEEAVTRFASAKPTTCVLTKLDEATSLGGAISTLIRARLPVTYVSEGQRVPEDLAPARAHQLIARAVELSRKSGASADEDLLRRRFGTVAHAIA
ncbi:flagellar biosynthesis protein FlhF [Peristeroidobacter soli]|jgi:flagellar biosynthesis protein FlhF|uniref:flagellar biosynthesis protein FlhF n=1 Tax=Peristeroidobacter soli TaxID=2497877 RepID=UPI00101D95E7|nr:flagellar biosynthesis protein FlhF [Peristeroidobacter soli]